MTTAPRFGQLDLVCADMDKTLAFYRLLGIEVPEASIWRTASGAHHVDVAILPGVTLAFDSMALAKAYNQGYRETRGGSLLIGFNVEARGGVDALYAKMTSAGHGGVQPPFDAFWGARYAVVADPDGNHIGIMSPIDPAMRGKGPDL